MSELASIDFYGKGEPLMEAMFGACVQWAYKSPEMRQAFELETGYRQASDPMAAMIDEATGYEYEVAEKFVEWVAENVWGRS